MHSAKARVSFSCRFPRPFECLSTAKARPFLHYQLRLRPTSATRIERLAAPLWLDQHQLLASNVYLHLYDTTITASDTNHQADDTNNYHEHTYNLCKHDKLIVIFVMLLPCLCYLHCLLAVITRRPYLINPLRGQRAYRLCNRYSQYIKRINFY